MKKLFSLVIIATMFAVSVSAQSTSPRWGGGPPQNDNTGRILTYASKAVTTTSATAVSYQVVSAWETIITVGTLKRALTDSLSIKYSYLGDRVTFIFTADTLTAGRVVTFGNNIKSAGTLTVPVSKKATASFIFDGVIWVETKRALMTN